MYQDDILVDCTLIYTRYTRYTRPLSVEESANILAKWCLSVGLFSFGHDSIGSVLAMYRRTIGQVSVRYMYQ